MNPRGAIKRVADVDAADCLQELTSEIDGGWIEDALREHDRQDKRERRLPASRVMWLVIGMGLLRDRCISEVAVHLGLTSFKHEGNNYPGGIVPSTIVEGRKALGPDPVMTLFQRTADEWAPAAASEYAWRGLSLFPIDGTTLRVPDSDSNAAEFGLPGSSRGRAGYPRVRLVAIMSAVTHMVACAAFGPCRGKRTGELSLARDLRERVPPASLLIGDKLFLAFAELYAITRRSTTDTANARHWLVPARKDTVWTVVERISDTDAIVDLNINRRDRRADPSLPETMRVRAIRYTRKGFRTRTLLTSLLDAQAYPEYEITSVFKLREEIELAHDELKTHMLERQEALRSKLPAGVRQEIWGILAAYNLVRHKMLGVAKEAGLPPLRISFRHTLQALRLSWFVAAWTTKTAELTNKGGLLRAMIALLILPERRSRHYRRHVKIKMSRYPRNPGRRRRGEAITAKLQEKSSI